MTEIADTAWGSTKMLNEKIVQNMTTNAEAVFSAAQAMATAKSLPELAKLQSEFVQKLAAQAPSRPRNSSIFRRGPRSTCSRRPRPQPASRSSRPSERFSPQAEPGPRWQPVAVFLRFLVRMRARALA